MHRTCLVLIAALGACLPAPAAPPNGPRLDSLGDPLPEGAVARFGTTRLWSPVPLQVLLFSPDGQRLAGDIVNGGALRMWDAASGTMIRPRDGDRPTQTLAAIAPDGKFLFAFTNPCCRLWDPTTGKTTDLWTENEQFVVHACYSPDGKTLAIGLLSSVVVLLDPVSGKERTRIELAGETPSIQTLTFAQDSRLLAIGFQGGNVWLWDCARGKRIRWFHTGAKRKQDPIASVAFSPNGRSLAVATQLGDKPAIKRFEMDADNEVEALTPHEMEEMRLVRYSADGKKLYGITGIGTILHWETATGKLLKPLVQGEEAVTAAAFDSAGQTVALQRGGMVEMIDVLTGKPRFPFRPFPALMSAAFAGKTNDLVASADRRGGFHFWDAATGRLHRSLDFPVLRDQGSGREKVPALSPDGKLIATWPEEFKGFRIVEAHAGKELWTAEAESGVGRLEFSPDGRQLAVVGAKGKCVEVWDVTARRRRRSIPLDPPREQLKLAWSPDSRSLAGIGEIENGFIWEVETEQLRHVFETHASLALTFLHDGRRLAVSTATSRIVLLRPGTNETNQIHLPDTPLRAICASSDGRWLAAGNKAGRVFLHELATGKQHDLPGHDAGVRALAFALDSSRLISASEDGTALIWDLKALPASGEKASKPVSLASGWEALGRADAVRAARARAVFEDRPEEALSFLKERLEPARPLDSDRLSRLLRDLDSTNFQTRQKTIRELEALGPQVEMVLRETAAKPPNLEMRKRLDGLLQKIDGPLTHPETLRAVRAVEILESIGSPAARGLLESLSRGDDAARLTREARAALERLRNR